MKLESNTKQAVDVNNYICCYKRHFIKLQSTLKEEMLHMKVDNFSLNSRRRTCKLDSFYYDKFLKPPISNWKLDTEAVL